ncbi:unnamed protein product [Chrysodeixis includens]|uniref:Uncharacterized protein n=1 Tax=Chrysodeixis includens TaxID=689277 RepID=A0A9N8PZ45_CHRIL|nr:unnamed protein product [Chrysodeixis includens]
MSKLTFHPMIPIFPISKVKKIARVCVIVGNKMTFSFKEFDKNSSDEDDTSSYEDSSEDDAFSGHNVYDDMSEDEDEAQGDAVEEEDDDDDEDDDDVVKAIKAEKNKQRDHPPAISCEDFIVDISMHPSKNLIAIANIVGDVLLYEYNNEETKLVNTLELHLKACRDVEFDDEGTTLYSTAKVCISFYYYFH